MARGIELSVNFLVGFVLAIVLFGFGVAFLYTIFGQAVDLGDVTKDEIDARVNELLCSAKEKICISGNRVPHEPGTLAVMGVFIYNVYDYQETFHIDVEAGTAIDLNKDDIPNDLILVTESTTLTIDANKQEYTGVGIQVPRNAEKGTYVFDVTIFPQTANDVDKRKIYVTVD